MVVSHVGLGGLEAMFQLDLQTALEVLKIDGEAGGLDLGENLSRLLRGDLGPGEPGPVAEAEIHANAGDLGLRHILRYGRARGRSSGLGFARPHSRRPGKPSDPCASMPNNPPPAIPTSPKNHDVRMFMGASERRLCNRSRRVRPLSSWASLPSRHATPCSRRSTGFPRPRGTGSWSRPEPRVPPAGQEQET